MHFNTSLIKNSLTGLLFALPLWIVAQNNPLGGQDTLILTNERVEDVITREKPVLSPPKPSVPPPQVKDFQYNSLDIYIDTDFTPNPPKAKLLEPRTMEKLVNNHAVLGFGRYVTPLAQLYLNSGKKRDSNFGLEFSHLSAHGDELKYREFREDQATIYGKYQKGYNVFKGKLGFYNTQYFNYADSLALGADSVRTLTETQLEDSIKMSFTYANLEGAILSMKNPEKNYYYDAALGLKVYNDRRDNSEYQVYIQPTGGVNLTESVGIQLNTDFSYTRGSINATTQNRTYVTVSPSLMYQSDFFMVRGGFVYSSFDNDADTASYSLFGPVVEAEYQLIPEALTIYAGFNPSIRNHHYMNFIRENRYLERAADIKPSVEKINAFAGINGSWNESLDFTARVSYKQTENALIYILSPENGAYFSPAYDSLTKTLGIQAEATYRVTEEIQAGTGINFNNFTTSTIEEYFHVAPFRWDLWASYYWQKQLFAKANINFYGPTPLFIGQDNNIIERKSLLLLNLSFDYRISPKFSVFLNANNVLNSKYQRWSNYEERPADILGGITISF